MRRLLKFLHTMGAIGLMGAMACILVLAATTSAAETAAGRAAVLRSMAAIGGWIFFPSLGLTLIAGLLAIAATPGFHNAGWAWAKALTGIVLFEGGLHALGPLQEAAKHTAGGAGPSAAATTVLGAEQLTLWVLLAVSAANVVLGVWRPRLTRLPP